MPELQIDLAYLTGPRNGTGREVARAKVPERFAAFQGNRLPDLFERLG
jgi:hypothetical protein